MYNQTGNHCHNINMGFYIDANYHNYVHHYVNTMTDTFEYILRWNNLLYKSVLANRKGDFINDLPFFHSLFLYKLRTIHYTNDFFLSKSAVTFLMLSVLQVKFLIYLSKTHHFVNLNFIQFYIVFMNLITSNDAMYYFNLLFLFL
jgi:hypothetical protein